MARRFKVQKAFSVGDRQFAKDQIVEEGAQDLSGADITKYENIGHIVEIGEGGKPTKPQSDRPA